VSECTSSNGRVALLSLAQIHFCLCFASRQTSHMPSKSSNPSISDRIAAGCRCASHWCQGLVAIGEAGVSSVFDDELILFFRLVLIVFGGMDWLPLVSELRV